LLYQFADWADPAKIPKQKFNLYKIEV